MKLYTKVEEPAPVRVLLPYVKVNPRLQLVVDCLRAQHVSPEPVKVGDGDQYHAMLSAAWADGEEFYVVEHDVIVWMGALRQMHECAEDWCALPTICHGRLIPTTLGCMKFGRRLIERNPGFFDDIPTTWFHLDANFSDKMGWPFIKPHSHFPPATHLNEVQWGDDISVRYALERKVIWQSMEAGKPVARVQYRMEGDGRRAERSAFAEVTRSVVTPLVPVGKE